MSRALAALLLVAGLAGSAHAADAFSKAYIDAARAECMKLPDAHEADIWACVIMAQDRELAKPALHDLPSQPSAAAPGPPSR